MDFRQLTSDTLARVQDSFYQGFKDGSLLKAAPGSLPLTTADTTTLGGTTAPIGINLEPQSKMLTPIMAPWRQNVPRTVRDGGNASLWKAVTKYAMGSNPFVAVGEPGNVPSSSFTPRSAGYKIISVRDGVTKEDMAAAAGYEDVQARVTTRALMKGLMLEELAFLGGNITALGAVTGLTATAVAAVADTTGGGIAFTAAAGFFNVVPVTLLGLEYLRSLATSVNVSYPKDWNGTDGLLSVAAVGPTITTATGLGIGTSVAANVTATTATTGGARLNWNPLPGAAAYIVFYGLTDNTTVGAMAVVANTNITLTNKNSTLGSAASVFATDNSGSTLAYDGILPQLGATGSGAFLRVLNGPLTSSGGEIVQIQDAFAGIFANAKLGEHWVVVGGQEQRTLTKLGIGAGGGPTIFANNDDPARRALTQGYRVGQIYNATTGDLCSVVSAPWLPGGTIIIIPKTVPYADSNSPAPFDWAGGYDWMRFDYPMTPVSGGGRAYPFEVACWGVLRGVFTGGCGLITGIYKA